MRRPHLPLNIVVVGAMGVGTLTAGSHTRAAPPAAAPSSTAPAPTPAATTPAPAATPAAAATPAQPPHEIEVKVIEAWRLTSETGNPPTAPLEATLAPLEKDLRSLPFHQFKLVDGMQKSLHSGESFQLQFGAPEKRRFLRVTAKGLADGKVRLDLAMEKSTKGKPRMEFTSAVSIAEGGTLVLVAGKPPVKDNVILLAISARKPRP